MDTISEDRLKLIHPKVAERVRKLAEMLLQESVDIRVVQGLRSWNEQQKLYDQGRTTPGKIVTKCLPGHSWHNFGMAVDVAPDDPSLAGWQADWNDQHPAWQRIHAVGDSLGFTCGADFRTFVDAPHLQLTGRFDVNPSDEVRQLFVDGGMAAIWNEAQIT